MPVFWIGFNVFMLPRALATKRYGGIAVASAGAIVAAIASFAAPGYAATSNTLIALAVHRGRRLGMRADERRVGRDRASATPAAKAG